MNAETLLMFVLGVDRAYLYAHPERELTSEEQARYDEVVSSARRACRRNTSPDIRNSGDWILWSRRQC